MNELLVLIGVVIYLTIGFLLVNTLNNGDSLKNYTGSRKVVVRLLVWFGWLPFLFLQVVITTSRKFYETLFG